MKFLLVFTVLLSACGAAHPNKIDSLKTDADVLKLMTSLDTAIHPNNNYRPYKLLTVQDIAADAKHIGLQTVPDVQIWQKADLNSDGNTDLLVYAQQSGWHGVYVVMDNANGTYKLIRLKGTLNIVSPAHIDGQTFLRATHRDCYYEGSGKQAGRGFIDTLVYKFENFIELDKNPPNYDIKSVTIYTGLCALGECPAYKIVLEPGGSARYVAGTMMPIQGVFTGHVKPGKTKQIMDLINYMRIKEMDDRYQPGCILDGGGWQLVVDFKDGSQKKILDFNGGGSFGLEMLYPVIAGIQQEHIWKMIK